MPPRAPELAKALESTLLRANAAASDVAAVKLAAAQAAADDGASEVEVVMGLAPFLAGDLPATRDEIAAVVRAFRLRGGRAVGVRGVIESAYLDDRRIRLAARVLAAANVDSVVVATGLAPRGASPLDVELLRGELDPRIGIKAVGGMRTLEEAADLLSAGASRLGTSSAAVLHDRALGRR